MKKLIIGSFIAMQIFFAGCSTSEKEESKENETFLVTTPVVKDTVYNNEYVADIQAIQNVEIRAKIKGYIEGIYVDEGKPVKAGQLLFSISPKEYETALLNAKAITKTAEVELQNAKTLVQENIVSKTELELAQAKLDQAKAGEALAALNLSYTEIRAPFDGSINRITNKKGSLVDEGTLLTAISDNKEVFAYFNVSEKDYLDYITTNQEEKSKEVALILANNTLYVHKGIIETTESQFDKGTGNIAFRARFPNPEQILKHGSNGKILVKTELKNAMLIPQKSTFEIQENIYVFAVDKDNKVQMRKITPAFRLSQLYAISSGLLASDKFIYEGIQRVKEGDNVVVKDVLFSKIINN